MKTDRPQKGRTAQNRNHRGRAEQPARPGRQTTPDQNQGLELKKGRSISLLIEQLDSDGPGLGYLNGTKVLVPGGLPGDRCLVRITQISKNAVSANLIKLLEPSPDRLQQPICELAGICHGCPLIAMNYHKQLCWKQQLVQSELEKYKTLQGVTVPGLLTTDRQLGYRTTAKLTIAGRYSDPYIGLYRHASHDLVDLEDCPIHHPLINQVMELVRQGIRKLKIPIWQEKTQSGLLRHLVVRVAEAGQELLLTFVTRRRAFNEIHHLTKFVQSAMPQVKVVCQNLNQTDSSQILGQQTHFVTRQRTVRERIGQVELLISPNTFLQAQNDGARLLYQTVKEWAALTDRQKLLDLYCGVGAISLTLAEGAESVLGVELNPVAVQDARQNAQLNRARNCRFESRDAAEMLSELVEDGWHFDLVVMNPPRTGCGRRVLENLRQLAPERIIYVSCSPTSLARDLDLLCQNSYRVLKLQPVDLFPHTVHLETIVLLERLTPKSS